MQTNHLSCIIIGLVKYVSVIDAMIKTVKTFGHFDILINNAGVMNDTIWEKQIDINLVGMLGDKTHSQFL